MAELKFSGLVNTSEQLREKMEGKIVEFLNKPDLKAEDIKFLGEAWHALNQVDWLKELLEKSNGYDPSLNIDSSAVADICCKKRTGGNDMNDQINSVNTSSTACPVPQACGSRLPCGLCLITNQRCSMMPWRPNIVWSSTNENTTVHEPHLPTTITCSSEPEVKY